MQRGLERSAPPVAAAVTLAVCLAWGVLALDLGPWPSLAAGLLFGASVYLALRLAMRFARRPAPAKRLAGLLALAGCLMLVAGLLAIRTPDPGLARLLGGVAFVTAAFYFAAALYGLLSGPGSASGP